jgi:signal transduction histidine kinase
MRIDWVSKLRHALQVWAFALTIATIQYALIPDRPYGPTIVFSLLIATITWAVIDLGRHLFASAAETGWPQGLQGLALVAGGIVAGYVAGTGLANQLCIYYGWYPPGPNPNAGTELRTSILITAMAGIVGTYYFYSINKSAYLERKMTEAHQHATEARLKLLETQLEPHMLFNTLANLRVLIGTDQARAQQMLANLRVLIGTDQARAQQMLDHMIAYLRATLNASRTTTHALAAEFDRLRDYLELMAVRMGPRLHFELDLPDDLAAQPVPTLLLQPLVENSIQHGLEPKVGGGSIRVAARRDREMLELVVADTGVGPGEVAPTPAAGGGKGFGLTQVRERLATAYGDAGSIAFGAAPEGGARVVIRLPLNAGA